MINNAMIRELIYLDGLCVSIHCISVSLCVIRLLECTDALLFYMKKILDIKWKLCETLLADLKEISLWDWY